MFSLAVSDHFMIAHSFKGEIFGPAQSLHGATYAVELALWRAELDPHGLVADIGLLRKLLREILDGLDYRNLDAEPAFKAVNTTTEFLAREIWRRARDRIVAGDLRTSGNLGALKVTLRESPVAWAAYEAAL
jgi:6-pyruvoyltetrahydropterin/6-carboxytetrahydropterin synthase